MFGGSKENYRGGGYSRCAVPKCPSRTGKGILFRLFPSEKKPELVECWKAALPKSIIISRNTAICELHFCANQFEKEREDGRKKLKYSAVPSMFNIDASNKGERAPLGDITQKNNPLLIPSVYCFADPPMPPHKVSKLQKLGHLDHSYARQQFQSKPEMLSQQSDTDVQAESIKILKIIFPRDIVNSTAQEDCNTLENSIVASDVMTADDTFALSLQQSSPIRESNSSLTTPEVEKIVSQPPEVKFDSTRMDSSPNYSEMDLDDETGVFKVRLKKETNKDSHLVRSPDSSHNLHRNNEDDDNEGNQLPSWQKNEAFTSPGQKIKGCLHTILDEKEGIFKETPFEDCPESLESEDLHENENSIFRSPSKLTREELLKLVAQRDAEIARLSQAHKENEQKILDLSKGHFATCDFRLKYLAASKAKKRIEEAYKRGFHSPWLSESRFQKLLQRLTRKSNRGLKWDTEDFRDGLILKLKCGTSGYSAFVGMFKVLPSARCLRETVQFIRFDAGILEEVFDLMRDLVKRMPDIQKYCTLVLDEIAIEESMQYDTSLKKWIGNCTLSSHSGKASKALVFLLAGVTIRWKIAVAVHFTKQKSEAAKKNKNDNRTGEAYADILKEIISKAHGIGLTVKAVVSDMGADNLAFWKVFGVKGDRTQEEVMTSFPNPAAADSKVSILPDPIHLLKSVKSMLESNGFLVLSQDVVEEENLPSPVVDYGHVQDLYQFESENELKVAFRLRPDNIKCQKHFQKMKVGSARAVVNHRTGVGLKQLAKESNNPNYETTAWFFMLLNTFFTLVTCRGKGLAVSRHREDVFKKAIQLIKKVDHVFTHMRVGNDGHWKPAQRGIKVLCSSLLDLISYFIDGAIVRYLILGRFTSDCIENLFSCIRLSQATPHAKALLQCLKVITLAQFSEAVRGSSYDYDESTPLESTDFLEEARRRAKERAIARSDESIDELMNNPIKKLEPNDYNIISKWEEQVLYDIAGSVICAIMSSNVTVCENCIIAAKWQSDIPHPASCITSLKEFTDLRSDDGQKLSLIYVSDAVFKGIVTAEISFRMYREKTLAFEKVNVKEYFVSNLMYVWDGSGIPECHALGRKILSFFIDARLKEFGKIMKEEAKFSSASEPVDRSSKSMAMHQAADNMVSTGNTTSMKRPTCRAPEKSAKKSLHNLPIAKAVNPAKPLSRKSEISKK